MILPIRCFSCGKVIGNMYNDYQRLITTTEGGLTRALSESATTEGVGTNTLTPLEALDILNVRKYCCRRMFLSHVNIIDDLLMYEN